MNKTLIISLAVVVSGFDTSVPAPSDIITRRDENRFCQKSDQHMKYQLSSKEQLILKHQDKPAGHDTHVFTHELIFGTLFGLFTAVWFYSFLTRKRPLF